MKHFPLVLLLCLSALPAPGASSASDLDRILSIRGAQPAVSERSDLRYWFRLSGADRQASLVVANPSTQTGTVRVSSGAHYKVRPGQTLTLTPEQIGWGSAAETVVKMSPGLTGSLQTASALSRLPKISGATSYDVVSQGRGALSMTPRLSAKAGDLPTVHGVAVPVEIMLGDTVQGALAQTDGRTRFDDGAFADSYQLTLTEARTIQIKLSSVAFDAYLSVWDPGDELVADDDDLGGGPADTDSRLELTLPAGVYIIEASSLDAGETGAYVLSVTDIGPAKEPVELSVGSTVEGVLEATDNRTLFGYSTYADYYLLEIPAAQNLTITLRSTAFDAYLFVGDLDRDLGIDDDDSGGGPDGTDASLTLRFEPGSYFIEASAFDPDSGGPYTLTVEEHVGPFMTSAGVVSSASFLGGAVAPGEILSFFGTDIGPDELAGLEFDQKSGLVSTQIGGTRILFDGQPAPMVFAFSGQSSAVAPFALFDQTETTIQIEKDGVLSNPVTMPVVSTKPSIFSINQSGMGPGAVLNQDFSLNGAGNPAAIGSVVQIFLSGGGQTNPPSTDGALAPSAVPLAELIASVTVTIGGQPAQVVYKGGAPGLINGLVQVNAVVAEGTPAGNVELVVTVGGVASQPGVTVAVQ